MTHEPEHEGWADLPDREMLSYAWVVLRETERYLSTITSRPVLWAEVATAVGHLDRRLRRDDNPKEKHG